MLKKIMMLTLLIVAIAVSGFAAGSYNNPAELVAAITNRSVDSVVQERQDGKPFCVIANEAGKLDEYKSGILEMRKEQLAQRVADGYMTQEGADRIIARMEDNLANCDGTGYNCGNGYHCGGGWGDGHGHGHGWRNGGNGCRW